MGNTCTDCHLCTWASASKTTHEGREDTSASEMRNVPVYGQPLHPGQPPASEHDRLMERSLVSPQHEIYPRPKIESTIDEEPVVTDVIKSEAEVPGTWQPKWLRAIVLGSFAALFVIFALGLPVLLQHSQRHNGIVAARQSFVYIWRFGPTASKTLSPLPTSDVMSM